MGQIVIEIPSNKKRRFVIDDSEQAELLLAALEIAVKRVKTNPAKLTRQQMEDFQDGQRADKIMRNCKTFYSHAEVKKRLGL